MTSGDYDGVTTMAPPEEPTDEPAGVPGARGGTEPEDATARDAREPDDHAPDLTPKLYVGLWLPAAGAFLTYAVMTRNYWVAFVGVELLLVGWFGLGKL